MRVQITTILWALPMFHDLCITFVKQTVQRDISRFFTVDNF